MKSTQQEAIQARESQYFTGKPCKHGHIAPRNTATMECIQCRRGYSRKYTEKVKEIRDTLSRDV